MPLRTEVPFGDSPSDTAILLLAAAESLHLDQSVVKTGTGVFIVPTEVAEEAGLGKKKKQEKQEPEPEPESEPEAPKRRSATKKSAKKK